MDRLPEDIERLIYSMDPTYHRFAWQRVCREIRGEPVTYDLLVLLALVVLYNAPLLQSPIACIDSGK